MYRLQTSIVTSIVLGCSGVCSSVYMTLQRIFYGVCLAFALRKLSAYLKWLLLVHHFLIQFVLYLVVLCGFLVGNTGRAVRLLATTQI